ncbi:hypothetical protein LEMLEM_LOCUS8584 [Lemmus lemmus]
MMLFNACVKCFWRPRLKMKWSHLCGLCWGPDGRGKQMERKPLKTGTQGPSSILPVATHSVGINQGVLSYALPQEWSLQ